MKYALGEILVSLPQGEAMLSYLQKATYEKPTYNETTNQLVLSVDTQTLIPVEIYQRLFSALVQYTQASLDLTMKVADQNYALIDVHNYIKYCIEKNTHYQVFHGVLPLMDQQTIIFKFADTPTFEKAKLQALGLSQSLKQYGIELQIRCDKSEATRAEDIQSVKKTFSEPMKTTAPQPEYQKYKPKGKQSLDQYIAFDLAEISEECHGIKIEGEIFEKETRTIMKTGKDIQTLYIKDATDALVIKRFERGSLTKEVLAEINVGDMVRVYGKVEFDSFSRELVMMPDAIEKIEKKQRVDKAEKKRVELHTHTKLSEMDGVSSVQEYIATAASWGMDAIAITDHGVVQSFPKAQGAMSKVNKGRETPFKVIYGIEMNMVDPNLTIVKHPDERVLAEAEYCVLDLETTGLSSQYDHIIEFGGQIIEQRSLSEKTLQCFVKPPVPVSAFTTSLTGITQQDVDGGLSLEAALDKILAFIGDRVIIAHNAAFDMSFLNDKLISLGRQPLSNPVIDTLDLSRWIHREKKGHRLGIVARIYGVAYDDETAHRADYDTQVLAQIYLKMMSNELKDVATLHDLANLSDESAFNKVFKKHTTVLAKNAAGLKELFELVTLSHTKYLSYLNKNATNIVAEPRITREALAKARDNGNLLLGSSCANGELFELAQIRSRAVLKEAMSFYDYIEVQPLESYRFLVDRGSIESMERLQTILLSIVETADELGKIVVGTSDAHYVHPEQKQIRDIYIQSQAIGGVRHPLYYYNQEKRRSIKSVDAHLRTTDEMLQQYPYLSKAKTYEIVVENTHKINDQIELVYPVKDKLYPPEIEGCADRLREICYDNARALYGQELPDIVEKRLEKELNSIIGNGFQVVYYISHLLVKKSLDDGYLVGSRGSVGSSFVATMSNITEVNPLAPHYVCAHCNYSKFFENGEVASGFDLPTIPCPTCGAEMRGDGQDIPFETFLGFEGDKVPDIDLNFSGEYQEVAHNYTKEVFGESYVYRAGTIGTVAEQTAFGYVKGFQEEMGLDKPVSSAQMKRLTKGCEGVKRTTGQHPGGIIVIPDYMDVHDFTPVQFPANNPNAEWKTTHFEFHDIHDNVLKLDILGHVDPTAMKLLEKMSGIDPKTIPINDPEVMKIFSSVESLKMDTSKSSDKTGAAGIPEFGTPFVRGILEMTKPTTFDELVRISGLSHGTDVWLNNAKDLIEAGVCTLKEVIGCRDDIMVYLLHKGLPPKTAFDIMEFVRKGRGLKDEWIPIMKSHNVEDWYIDSCRKIKYMFPKAHAVAYVLMAVRIAWFKVHYPQYYYAVYFSIRCDAYEIETMIQGEQAIRSRMSEIKRRMESNEFKNDVSKKEKDVYSCLELALEMNLRGLYFANIDIMKSHAKTFMVDPERSNYIIPPFTAIDGLGESVALSVVAAREATDEHGNILEFLSKEDLTSRTGLNGTHLKKLEAMGVVNHLQDENQLSLF